MSWTAIDAQTGVWSAARLPKPGWSLGTIAVRARDGGLAIVSPTAGLGDAAHEALRALGEPRFLLAPNHFHYLGLREWTERYPGATVVASATARPRLSARSPLAFGELDALRAALPEAVTVVEPPHTKTGETWLRVATARGPAWVVGDAFFNVAGRATGAMGLVLRATRTAPGLSLGKTFVWLGLRDKRSYAAWLAEQLDGDPPALLVPCHGDVYDGEDLVERLRALARARLGID